MARVLVILTLVALAAWLLWPAAGPVGFAPAATNDAPVAPARVEGVAAARSEPPGANPVRREIAEEEDADAFVCTDEDGEPIAGAVRDGVVVEVRDADGEPCANCRIGVYWRKGFGRYGWDRGRTAPDGTFATTVHEVRFFEMLELQHPTLGGLESHATPIATAHDPGRVVYMVARLATVSFTVGDLDGAPVAGAAIECSSTPEPPAPRVTLLVPATPEAVTDEHGRATMQLPVGAGEVVAKLGEQRPAQEVLLHVPPAGCEVDLLALPTAGRREVVVEAVLPPGAEPVRFTHAWCRAELPVPKSPLVIGCETKQRDYPMQAIDAVTWRTHVDPLPWLVSLRTGDGWQRSERVAVGQSHVRLVLAAAPERHDGPTTELLVTVLDVDGSPEGGANVRLHLTPDVVHGSDRQTDRTGRVVLRTPANGKRACVSARDYKRPFSIVGPVELLPGRQELTIRLQPGGRIEGTVLDRAGQPVAAMVVLRRPAGALRGLAADVPAILEHSASGDSIGTGEPGRFHFDGVGPGEHEVWAFPELGGWPARAIARAGDDVTLRPGDGCEGVLLLRILPVDAATGEAIPVDDVQVDGSLYSARRAAADEPFSVPVRAGEVEVYVRAIDRVVHRETIVVSPGMPVLVVRLEPSPLRFVRVVDVRGLPCWAAEIGAVAAGQEIEFTDQLGHSEGSICRTDRNGRATLRGLPPRTCTLVVTRGEGDDEQRREFVLPPEAGRSDVFDLVWR